MITMKKLFLVISLLVVVVALALDIQIPPYLKEVESTVLPPLIIQTLFGEYGKQIEKLEIAIVEGDKAEALRFWGESLPSKGWRPLLTTPYRDEQATYAYNKGNNIFLIAPCANPRQMLLVEAKGVRDVGIFLGMVMKGLTNLAVSLAEEREKEIQLPKIPSFPQAKLILEARIPGKVISERVKREEAPKGGVVMGGGGVSSPPLQAGKASSILQSILADVEEIHFREFQLPSRVYPREVINYYEGELRKEGWQMVIKNVAPQPSFPYVLICALKGDYVIISLIPEYPTRALHTLDEIILVGKGRK